EADGFNPVNVELLRPLLEICQAHDAPVIVRTGFHPCEPLLFLPLAEAFPEVKIILAHMGGRIFSDAMIVAERAANVYLETSAQMPMAIVAAINHIGAERIVFGTDTPYGIAAGEVERIKSLNLSNETLSKVCETNMLGILRLQQSAEVVRG